MRSVGRTRRSRLRSTACVATIAIAVLVTGAPAFAGVLDNPLDPLDPVEEILEPTATPTPDEKKDPTSEVNEEVNEVVRSVTGGPSGGGDGGGGLPAPVGGDPDTSTEPDGGAGGPTKQASSDEGSAERSEKKGSNAAAVATVEGATPVGDPGKGSYSTLAARGTVAAIERAFSLAGPLAPPLLLGAIALAAVIGLARGSNRLVKTDDTRFPEQTYRL